MCTIGQTFQGILSFSNAIFPAINEYNEQKSNLNYRTTLALKNMETAKQEAYAQKQLGIEEARKQKIQGLKESKKLMAQNASGGFTVSGGNNLYNYDSAINEAYSSAEDIQNTYAIRSDNYFEKANDYLNEAKSLQKEKKNAKWNSIKTALGSTTSVAKRWYSTGSFF